MASDDLMMLVPYALTFQLKHDPQEQGGRDRLKALLDAATDGPLSNVLQLVVKSETLRFRLLLEEGKTVAEQVDALEAQLSDLGFPGRDGWWP